VKLLLDTHALLWFLADDPRLSASARTTIENPANPRLLSPVSLQEIAIKVQLNKLRLHEPFAVIFPAQLALNRIDLLPIQVVHIEPLTTLLPHHKDPFDRLIATTALVEGLTLVSSDLAFDAYGVTRLW
jgi:PIN domain nuclease of toxin-antitoxin system